MQDKDSNMGHETPRLIVNRGCDLVTCITPLNSKGSRTVSWTVCHPCAKHIDSFTGVYYNRSFFKPSTNQKDTTQILHNIIEGCRHSSDVTLVISHPYFVVRRPQSEVPSVECTDWTPFTEVERHGVIEIFYLEYFIQITLLIYSFKLGTRIHESLTIREINDKVFCYIYKNIQFNLI